MPKIIVTGSDGRFGNILKKFNDKKYSFPNFSFFSVPDSISGLDILGLVEHQQANFRNS